MKRILAFNALFCILLCLVVPAGAEPLIIRHIAIEGTVRTRAEIIRRELLFQSGDRLDSLALSETERNLRQLLFLGDVRILVRPDSAWADLTVQVEDLYARALSPLLSGNVRELSYGLTALDFNLLGRGQIAQVTLFHDAVTGNSARAFYRNPRLQSSRHVLTTDLGLAEEGHHAFVAIAQPFYALSTPWSYGLSAYDQKRIQRRYSGGALIARYADRISGGALHLTRSTGDRTKIRPGIALSVSDRRFAPKPGYAYTPSNRRRVLPSASLTLWRPRYEKQTFVRELGRIEDLQIGSWITGVVGLSATAIGSDRNFVFYRLQVAPRFKLSDDIFAFGDIGISGRRQSDTYADLHTHAQLALYARIHAIHTIAFRTRLDALARSEDADQLLLGLDHGLRGYLPRRFDGTRRYIANLEARPTLYRHPRFALSGAVFLDAGDAWTPANASPALNAAAGGGLRLCFTRIYDQPILRADLSYALRDRAWQIALGLGHYF